MRLKLTALLATLVALPAAAQQAAPGTPTTCPAPAAVSAAELRRQLAVVGPRLAAMADGFGEVTSADAARADSLAGDAARLAVLQHAACTLARAGRLSAAEYRYFVLKVAPLMRGGTPRPRPARPPELARTLSQLEAQVAKMRLAITRMSRVESERDATSRATMAQALRAMQLQIPSVPGLSDAQLREICLATGVESSTMLSGLTALLRSGTRDLVASDARVNQTRTPDPARAAALHDTGLMIPLAFDRATEAIAARAGRGTAVECGRPWQAQEERAVKAVTARMDELVKKS